MTSQGERNKENHIVVQLQSPLDSLAVITGKVHYDETPHDIRYSSLFIGKDTVPHSKCCKAVFRVLKDMQESGSHLGIMF